MGNKNFKAAEEQPNQEGKENIISNPNKPKHKLRYTDFKMEKLIGEGTYGQVFLAKHERDSRYYAMKAVKKTVALEAPDAVKHVMFERDVLCLGSESPFIVQLFCTFQTKYHLFYVTEFLNGGDLFYHVANSIDYDENWVRFYAIEIACGIQFLHKKRIIHRDLKLGNILMSAGGHCKIADFGLSKRMDEHESFFLGICGTIDHLAPEVLEGRPYNHAIDWWAFGIILYEMITKSNLFYGQDVAEVYNMIQLELDEELSYPFPISPEAKSCIESFLQIDYNKRLGMASSPFGDIRDHPFFSKLDWDKIEKQEMEPPFKPVLASVVDTACFEREYVEKFVELSKVDKSLMERINKDLFQGFSFVNDNYKQNF